MLGNPLYDGGVFFQQFFIPLLGGVLYAGKEEPLIDMEAFDDFSSYICRNTGFCPRFLKNLPASLPTVQPALCSPRKKARCPFIQAVERCDEIPLEKNWKVMSCPSLLKTGAGNLSGSRTTCPLSCLLPVISFWEEQITRLSPEAIEIGVFIRVHCYFIFIRHGLLYPWRK